MPRKKKKVKNVGVVDRDTPFVADDPLMKRLKVYVRHGKNVLFVGKKGVGKTSIVRALWDLEKLNYKFFSAATMDPWVDFLGVPREQVGEDGEKYLDLVRPREFQDDTIEALFFDEFNRAPKKVRNAVMELIQFKSINGKKFSNLKVVWAAINPENDEDEEYDVEALDPAQKDRFHIQIDLKYEPSYAYFSYKYGPETAEAAISWWKSIQDPKVLNEVSPRRLDYALEIDKIVGGNLDDVLPKASNPAALRKALRQRPALAMLRALKKDKNKETAREFLEDDNNFYCVIPEIMKIDADMDFFLPLLEEERLNNLIVKEVVVQNWCWRAYKREPIIKNALNQIVEAGTSRILTQQIKKRFQQDNLRDVADIPDKPKVNKDYIEPASNMELPEKSNWKDLDELLEQIRTDRNLKNTFTRAKACQDICQTIPAQITKNEAIQVLDIMDRIIKDTHPNMIAKWKDNLMGTINACVKELLVDNYQFSKFKGDYPNVLQYVVNNDGFYLEVGESCENKNKIEVVHN